MYLPQVLLTRFKRKLRTVDRAATVSGAADATLVVRMQCCFGVDRDLFAGLYVSQGEEENVVVKDLHEGVWNARVVDVMRAVPAAAPVKTPTAVDFADAQHLSM